MTQVLKPVRKQKSKSEIWTVLVMIGVLTGTGMSECVIVNLCANSADTLNGFGALLHALFVLVGLAMAVALLWQRIRVALASRK